MKNRSDSVLKGIPVAEQEPGFVDRFLANNDFSPNTLRAFAHDLGKFARWFVSANKEPFSIRRVTTGDVSGFRDHLRRNQVQAGHLATNPATKVKELKRQQLAPKGLDRSQVRRLLREVELRDDVRANAVFSLFLWSGCRCGDAVELELPDLLLGERSGSAVFRNGKGNKQRSVPLPLPARRALVAYLDVRPPVSSSKVFLGERGPLGDRGVRSLCAKYSAITGIKIYPHLLRHTMAHQFLADTNNDLVSLAQILGHESLSVTARYTKRTEEQLATSAERLNY